MCSAVGKPKTTVTEEVQHDTIDVEIKSFDSNIRIRLLDVSIQKIEQIN